MLYDIIYIIYDVTYEKKCDVKVSMDFFRPLCFVVEVLHKQFRGDGSSPDPCLLCLFRGGVKNKII